MKQIFCKSAYHANWAQATEWLPLIGGNGDFASTANNELQSRTPWSCPGTLSNLSIHLPVAQAGDVTFTVLLNGVASALLVTVPAGQVDVTNITDTVAVVAGDGLTLKLVGGVLSGPGYAVSWAVQFDGTNAAESGYAIGSFSGSIPSSGSDSGWYGGALGNGVFQSTDPASVGTSLSGTYSIVSTAGTITRLDAQNWTANNNAGTWTAMLRLNGVTQNGSGGTVDTRVVLTGGTFLGHTTFVLPVVPGDHVDVYVVRTVASSPFSTYHLSCSVAFTATVDGSFLLCGGNNNTTSPTAVTYMWMESIQLETVEAQTQAPVGVTGYYLKGLYVEDNAAPAATKRWTHTARVDGADTAITLQMLAGETSKSVLADVPVNPGQFMTLSLTPTNTPAATQVHWALVGFSGATPTPPTPTGTTYATRRERTFALPTTDGNKRMTIHRLELIMQTGVGLTTGQGSDPQVMLQLSTDWGHTWGPERWMSAGPMGQYARRVFWQQCGQVRAGGYVRIVVSDPVRWALLDCWMQAEEGTS